MFRTLRDRLVLSHVLPMLIILPVMGIVLIYILESRFLIPQLTRSLVQDARLLTEVTRAEYIYWGNPVFFERLLTRTQLDPSIRVMFLSKDSRLLFSSDPDDQNTLGHAFNPTGINEVLQGSEIVSVQYPGALLFTDVIDVLAPVLDPSSNVIGIVRVTYHITNVAEVLSQTRLVILVVLLVALVSGVLMGLLLAINLEKPIKKVTSAIYDLAQGGQREPVVEEGPLEIRAQIRAINYLVGRLSSLEQSRRQLLANLVHELGRPLGALLSAIQALSKGAGRDPKLLNDLTTGMEEEITQLQHVLDDLAHLHDQVLGTLELKLEPVALSEWLPRVLLPLQQAAREKHLDWRIEIPEGLPTLGMDPVRMGQVVGNLASNAIKYTPPGGSVTITAGRQDSQAWIRFADSGVGIVQEEQEKVFQPFFRGSQGRRIKQGMGLGLTIARDLVAAHSGHIDLESKPGEGSRFTVWLPVVRTPPLE